MDVQKLDVQRLIEQAREFADLANGDYEAIRVNWIVDVMQEAGCYGSEISDSECELLACAPVMAGLLVQLADALEALTKGKETADT